jgi:hypothetical protein
MTDEIPTKKERAPLRARTVIQVAAPIVAIATLMLGLRVGAKDAVRAAVVFGAPPARPAGGQPTRLAWQIVTFLDDRGVRETIPIAGLSVVARSKGKEARWSGASNADGIAEVSLPFEGLAHGDDVELEVRAEGDPAPLAAGHARWQHVAWATAARDRDERDLPAARPTSRTGAIGLDVLVESGRLVPGFPTPIWVRATPPPGVSRAGIAITAAPEPGLVVEREATHTCDDGWADIPATAQAHVVGAAFDAKAPSGATGRWFGALPVAPGAFQISAARVIEEGKPEVAVLIAPNPRNVVYAEIDDESGRAAAAALPVAVEPGDPTPRARFELPPLASGVHWIVVSGEPRGAEHLGGAAVARPILVGKAANVNVQSTCSIGPWLAQRRADGFPRWIALDGLPARSAANRGRHRAGMLIGLVALLAAGALEVLLLVAAAREARVAMQLAELDAGEAPAATKVVAKPPGGSLAVALLLAVIGFALLAVLLVMKG